MLMEAAAPLGCLGPSARMPFASADPCETSPVASESEALKGLPSTSRVVATLIDLRED